MLCQIEEAGREGLKELKERDAARGKPVSEEEAERLVETFSEEDWKEFRQYEDSLRAAQEAGFIKSDKQVCSCNTSSSNPVNG